MLMKHCKFSKLSSLMLLTLVTLSVVEAAARRDNPDFEILIDDYLGIYHDVGNGRRSNDGSAEYYESTLNDTRELLSRLETIDRDTLTFQQDLDYRFLRGLLRSKIMDGEQVKRWQQDPRLYLALEPIISSRGGLLYDELRPVQERADAIISNLQGIPRKLENAKTNLIAYIPLWHQNSLEVLEGNIEIVEKDLNTFAARVPESRDTLLAAREQVLDAYAEFQSFLNDEWPHRPVGDWKIGAEIFDYRIRNLHLIDDLTAEQFYDWGRKEYEDQLHVLRETAKSVDPDRTWQEIEFALQEEHPSAENMIDEHRKAVQRTRPWVIESGLFSMPFDEDNKAIAAATPAVYGRQQWYGYGGAPRGIGLSEPGGWRLVPVDPRWSPERTEEFLQGHNYAMINTMVNHEVYPGHGMIQLYLNHNPRKLRTYESSYANQAFCYYIEWDLIPNYGFYPADKQDVYQIEKERNKLWRYARPIYDAGMHLGKVGVDEAVHIMHRGVLFAERFAFIEVEYTTRGGSTTAIPTWGYHQFLKLRDDYFAYMAARGQKGTLLDFHDRVMKIGMLPVDLIREAMFYELEME
ncbi:MAG: DUF885 family protein [Proteobacteria bacterium]|nr:DUF885 family protein [Pseudomonadota bacterium]